MKHRTFQALTSTRKGGYPQQAGASLREAAMILRGSLLYAIRLDELIKIGWTSMVLTDRRDRLKVEAGATVAQILAFTPGSRDDELELHHRLAGSVAHDREWYHPTPEVMAVVNEWRAQWGREPVAA